VYQFLANPAPQTFSGVYRLFVPQVLRYFRSRGCEDCLAEDLSQETMLAVYRQCGQLRERDLFRAWFFQIAKNQLLQHVRSMRRRPPHEGIDKAGPEICAQHTDPLMPVQLAEWMQFLSEEERELVRLRYMDGLEFHEIAAATETPQGTVQWRIFQALKKLAARFGSPGK
jgi:RNA polymerase sigma-70 factor, ECF subfamily